MKYILITAIGLLLGWVLNALADILPGESGALRPTCPACSTPYPLSNYLFRYRCSHCGKQRSLRVPLVQIAALAISFLVYFFPPSLLTYWTTLPLVLLLGTIFIIDIEHHLVLLKTIAVGAVLCLIYGIALLGWKSSLLGGLGGLAITLAFYFLGVGVSKLVGAIRHKQISQVAFGLGDVTTTTIFGFLVGWPSIVGVLLIAIIAFAVISVIFLASLILSKKYQAFASALPFAPFLVLGVVVLFYI
jgi:leader peptidase (prepilin peptidase)/N-methyltransferase